MKDDHARKLAEADMILARNLDMLGIALRARALCTLDTPIVYECLDVHTMLTGDGVKAKVMRGIEGRLLKKCKAIMISSPGFEREHFARYYPGAYRAFLFENRLIDSELLPKRPDPKTVDVTRPLRIGWFGNLRCKRTLGLLLDLAKAFPQDVQISLRGYHAHTVIPDFEARVAQFPNVTYGGRYVAPGDLPEIYGDVDLIWTGDWYEEGANSLWLLPNRIYEGGYFATPALAPTGTETARWLSEKAGAFFLDEPVADSLQATVGRLIEARSEISEMSAALSDLPRSVFVEDPKMMQELLDYVVPAQHAEATRTAAQ